MVNRFVCLLVLVFLDILLAMSNTGSILNLVVKDSEQKEFVLVNPPYRKIAIELGIEAKCRLIILVDTSLQIEINSEQNQLNSQLDIGIFGFLSKNLVKNLGLDIVLNQESGGTICNFNANFVVQGGSLNLELMSRMGVLAENCVANQNIKYLQNGGQVKIFPHQQMLNNNSQMHHGVAKIKLSTEQKNYLQARGLAALERLLAKGLLDKILGKTARQIDINRFIANFDTYYKLKH